jgi:glycosyltransferase involved in cell wall biosynthesis
MNSREDEASPDMAVAICTYNPDGRVLTRVLQAVGQLEYNAVSKIECVIVDNNSAVPVAEMQSTRSFLESCPWARVVREPRQGIAFARIAALKATTAPVIVFVDDDNELAKDYLKVARRCLADHPHVGVWGPGNIVVEFLDRVPDWFAQNFRTFFHERRKAHTEYGRVMGAWTRFYPVGSGQVVRRDVLEKYAVQIENGQISASGRRGMSLASGEDIQIVWEAVKMGYAAGVCPELKLVHLIPSKRANLKYVRRLIFGTASSYLPALVESFPSERAKQTSSIPSNRKILFSMLKLILRDAFTIRYRFLLFDLARYLGRVVGQLRAARSEDRRWVYGLVKLLQLE